MNLDQICLNFWPPPLCLAAESRRRRLEDDSGQELPLRFEGRISTIDTCVAEGWGKTVSRSEAAECPIGATDALLAATAEAHQMTLPQHFRFSAA